MYTIDLRPDVSQRVHRCSRVMSFALEKPTLELLRSIAAFLLATKNDGITYGGEHTETNDQLTGSVHAAERRIRYAQGSRQ